MAFLVDLVRLAAKFDLVPRAWCYFTRDDATPLVSLKLGTLFYLLDIAEARKFAAEIAAAADAAEAGPLADTPTGNEYHG